MKLNIESIYCESCGKFQKIKVDDMNPLDLMCDKCCLVIASVKLVKQKGK